MKKSTLEITDNQIAIIINRDQYVPESFNFNIKVNNDTVLQDICIYELHDFALQISASILFNIFNTNEVGNAFNYELSDINDEEKEIVMSVFRKIISKVISDKEKHLEYLKMIKSL